MTINITLDNTRQESLGANGANLIHSLSELAQTPGNTVTLRGNISSLSAYEDDVNYLNTEYGPDFIVNAVKKYINFNDTLAESLLLNASIGDGVGITKLDAALITLNQFEGLFNGTAITNADWFQYFTGIGTFINQLKYGFQGCTSLTSIIFPDLLLNLGYQHNSNGMFSSCTSLLSVVFPRDLTLIRENFFKDCTNLTNLDFSKCTQPVTFWDSCFSGDTSISSINFPSNVVSIKASAFSTTNLSSIEIPASVTFLAGTAFNNCTSLTSITFEDGNANLEIEGNQYYNETGLGQYIPSHTLTLPARTTTIGARAIARNVTTLYVLATVPPTLSGSLLHNGQLTKIYVPASAVADYQSSWSSYSSIIEAIQA